MRQDRGAVFWRMGLALLAVALSPRPSHAAALALSPTRVAVASSDRVTVYALPEGTVIATLPMSAREAAWDGDRLVLQLRTSIATWSPAAGLAISPRLPYGESWLIGPHDLVYSWDSGVRVTDPWTGLTAQLSAGFAHLNRAGTDGYIDYRGLHAWDGHLVVPAGGPDDILGIQDCSVLTGPRMLCHRGSVARLRGEGTDVTWRAAHGGVEQVVAEGPAAGTLLVRDAGADGGMRLLRPDGSVAVAIPKHTGTFALSAEGLAWASNDHVEVYGLDGAPWASFPVAPAGDVLLAPLTEPALLSADATSIRLLAASDGRLLTLLGAVPFPSARSDADGVHLAFHDPRPPQPRFHRFNDTTWIYEADGAHTTTTIKRPGVEGDFCGDSLGLVTPTGEVESYGLKGTRRWVAPFPGPDKPHLQSCSAAAWLVVTGDHWAVLEPGHGKVVMRGDGVPNDDWLPELVVVDKTGVVTSAAGTWTLPPGFHARGFLPARGALPAGLLAERYGAVARVDATGVRWMAPAGARMFITDGTRVYMATSTATIALDATSGALLWAAPGGDPADARLQVLLPP